MKKLFFLMVLVFLAARPVPAQLNISSFNQNGRLTWTNIVSNAQYRVEWSGSVTGAWQSFDALTNLNLISATNNSVTVQVPTFYRVIWLNPPAPEPTGNWDYRSYDKEGVLVITGRLSFVYQTNQFYNITGTRDLEAAGNYSTNGNWPVQRGTGAVSGRLDGNALRLNLSPATSDDFVELHGQMYGGYFAGIWIYNGLTGPESPTGTFVALKRPTQP